MSSAHFFTYEQFVKMHGYSQWRRRCVESVPDDELGIIRWLEFGPTNDSVLTKIKPTREDRLLSYVRQVSPSSRYDPPYDFRRRALNGTFNVTGSVGDVLLSIRAELGVEPEIRVGDPDLRQPDLQFSLGRPDGDVVEVPPSQIGREDDRLIIDEMYSAGALASMRGEQCSGTWKFTFNDRAGVLRVSFARFTVTAKDAD